MTDKNLWDGKCFYNNERKRPVREQLHADGAQLRLRDREDGGGLRGPQRAHGPGRGAARHRLGLRVNLYVPAPRLSLCRHAEQGCGVAAKKSPVAAKKPVYKRTTIVDETSLLGVTAVLEGGGASLRTRDRGLGHGHGGLFTTLNTQAKFYSSFYSSTTAGTRPGSRVTSTTTSSAANPALRTAS